MQAEFNSLIQLVTAIPDEQAAIDYFTAIRWKNGAFCPYCGSVKVYHFGDKKTHKCGDCRQRFSIKVGTIFEGTKLPLRKWLMAVWLITSHKKGIASTRLAKDLGITQKSAWFVLHRLRAAATTKSFNTSLTGFVEADETYIGGKETNKTASKRKPKQHSGKGKAMVIGVVQRNGDLRAIHVDGDSTHGNPQVRDGERGRRLKPYDRRTCGLSPFCGLSSLCGQYSKKEYVRDEFIRTNTLEGAWSLLKRQIYGIHHFVSPKRLNRYVSEMTWRYNRREMEEGNRVSALIAGSDGRLTYKALIA